jgi:3-dehydroquinate dehydratase-2
MLGKRDRSHYGDLTLEALQNLVQQKARECGYETLSFQSNHEGALIDWIQEHAKDACGIIINPGALTHYSYALLDALLDTGLPCVEVHLSGIHAREEWRRISVIAPACIAQVSGKKEKGYEEAVDMLMNFLRHPE